MSRSTSLAGSALTREAMAGRLPGTPAAAGIGTGTPVVAVDAPAVAGAWSSASHP
jgi:hypothetical protein